MDSAINKTSKERSDMLLVLNRFSQSLTEVIEYTNWSSEVFKSLSSKITLLIESDEIKSTLDQYDDKLVELR